MVDGFGVEFVSYLDHSRFASDSRRCRCRHEQVPGFTEPEPGRSDSRLRDGISDGCRDRGASCAIGNLGGSSGGGNAIFAFQRSPPSSPYSYFASADVAWVIGTNCYGRYAGVKSGLNNKLETNVGRNFSC